MKKTILTLVMAALCLNFCYGQEKQDCPTQTKSSEKKSTSKTGIQQNNSSVNQPYKFDFSGFKSGYKPGYRISDDEFMKGKSITVRNYTITQFFALALRLRSPDDNSKEQANGQDQIIIDVRQPDKLNTLYCYKLVVPFYLTDNFYIIMQRSLNEEFPQYTAKMERRGREDVMVIRDKEY